MSVIISKHAKERYAERIMDRDHPTDIAMFIREHDDKIQQDIEKMLEFGRLLYEGKTVKDPSKTVGVTLNGHWVIIWDTKEFVVITLYCIDLGVGEEVNKAFIDSAVAQIEAAGKEYEEAVAKANEFASTYKDIIEKGELSIAKYKKMIKDIEAQINGCRQMIASTATDREVADDKLREKVEILIGRQKF